METLFFIILSPPTHPQLATVGGFENGSPVKFFALAALLAFMLASEITIDWPIFPNEYNWFHM